MCESIYEIVDRTAAGRSVALVHLDVGRLRQVVPDTLAYCWSVVAGGTPLAGSSLVVHTVPATLTCRGCASVTTLGVDLLLACSHCDGTDVDVTSGEEFMLTALELAEA
jgi:hydrogenase nickel incorporation protein HypA/HybF